MIYSSIEDIRSATNHLFIVYNNLANASDIQQLIDTTKVHTTAKNIEFFWNEIVAEEEPTTADVALLDLSDMVLSLAQRFSEKLAVFLNKTYDEPLDFLIYLEKNKKVLSEILGQNVTSRMVSDLIMTINEMVIQTSQMA